MGVEIRNQESWREAPCKAHCPAGVDVPRCLRLISRRRFDEALAVIRDRNPFPAICGRVCFHPCEQGCQDIHNHVGGPVAINTLERFVSEQASKGRYSLLTRSSGKRVAVVGSGPAGLSAAYYLIRQGYDVAVYEQLPIAGGMLATGIPEFVLPMKTVETEIDYIRSLGVDIKTNMTIGKDFTIEDLQQQRYKAIFLAVGAQKSLTLNHLPGVDLEGIYPALHYLKEAKLGRGILLRGKVLVIGGGNVAMDSARTAIRLGAEEVHVACLESRSQMPAFPWEVERAEEEGARIHTSLAPQQFRARGKNIVAGVEFRRVRSVTSDSEGRIKWTLTEDPADRMTLEADAVIIAVGESPDLSFLRRTNLEVSRRGTLVVDSDTLATSVPGVFAGGDAMTGPSSVIDAIAAGRKAAISIDKYLGGSGDMSSIPMPPAEELPTQIRGPSVGKRAAMLTCPLEERTSAFAEVQLGFDEATAVKDSTRCLWCEIPISIDSTKCVGCLRCAFMCSLRFEEAFNPIDARIKIVPPDRSAKPGEAEISFADDCDGCGICVRACAYGALTREIKTYSTKS